MKLTHPASGQTIETSDPDMYLSQGWQPIEETEPVPDEPEDENP